MAVLPLLEEKLNPSAKELCFLADKHLLTPIINGQPIAQLRILEGHKERLSFVECLSPTNSDEIMKDVEGNSLHSTGNNNDDSNKDAGLHIIINDLETMIGEEDVENEGNEEGNSNEEENEDDDNKEQDE